MKKKTIILIVLLICTLFISGLTYSSFNSNTNIVIQNQKVASFVFEGKKMNSINFSLDSLKPGDSKDYLFSVANNNSNKSSDVTINYRITVETYHFIPLIIKLYKDDKNILTCDESYSRNVENKLICNSDIFEMNYNEIINEEYKLSISFPDNYNDSNYSNIIDYIDIKIKSWQK